MVTTIAIIYVKCDPTESTVDIFDFILLTSHFTNRHIFFPYFDIFSFPLFAKSIKDIFKKRIFIRRLKAGRKLKEEGGMTNLEF